MNINKIIINSYGKLKNKEITLEKGINIIYGQNESGKSTLIKFIINMLYGISKNKNGKEISEYDKYKPWSGEEFSGKIKYELDNQDKYEIYRDFNKKNPKIFNEKMEDISKEFNIDKNKGNEFFYEQTKIDGSLFLSTLAINQGEVKLEAQNQNFLIQKIANLAQTGDDATSFKKVIDRINRRQLDEIGTERSREKPINIIEKKINELEEKKEELLKYKELKYKFEEQKDVLKDEISDLESEFNILKDIKSLYEEINIENTKIEVNEKLKNENIEKLKIIDGKIKSVENILHNNNEKRKSKKQRNSIKKKINIALITIIIINIIQFILIKNNIIKYSLLLTIPIFLIAYFIIIYKENLKIKNSKNNEKANIEKINFEISNLENEKKLIQDNTKTLQNEINNITENLKVKEELEKEKIKNKYITILDKYKLEDILDFKKLEYINLKIEQNQKYINEKKVELCSFELDNKNIDLQLENLSNIEEELINNNKIMLNLKNKNESMNLAKEVLLEVYNKMKNTVTPMFTKNLSKNIASITDGKYNNAMFNEDEGLIVEIENGEYVSANKFSIGTIDQLYLSLRLSMIDNLSEEKVPILLDEVFAFYDNERLSNIIKYLYSNFKDRQIVIFTCTNREKEILDKLQLNYNLVEM